MKELHYKGMVFDDFELYGEGESGEEIYGDYNSDSLENFDSVDVYICPECVKKYGLYKETETNKDENETEIEYMKECEGEGCICGIKGCYNGNSYDINLNINICSLEDKKKMTYKEFMETEAYKISDVISVINKKCQEIDDDESALLNYHVLDYGVHQGLLEIRIDK